MKLSTAQILFDDHLERAWRSVWIHGGLLAAILALLAIGPTVDLASVILVAALMLGMTARALFTVWWLKHHDIDADLPGWLDGRTARENARRDELRDRRRLFLNAWLTYGVIACVGLVALVQTHLALQLRLENVHDQVAIAGLVKPAVRSGEWWRLLTSTYLHGGINHFFGNMGVLALLGATLEGYAPPTRLPFVYLVSAVTGGLASTWLYPSSPSIGASGAILGLAGYLFVLGWRRPDQAPGYLVPWLGALLAPAFYLGAIAFFLIDNGAHLGGLVGGALVGVLTIPRQGHTHSATTRAVLALLGWLAIGVLVAGASVTAGKLLAGG
jgi:membrane associated rhomboid family serine protease